MSIGNDNMTCHIVCQQIDCVSRCNRTVNHTIVLLVYVCKKIITFVDINVLLIDFFVGKRCYKLIYCLCSDKKICKYYLYLVLMALYCELIFCVGERGGGIRLSNDCIRFITIYILYL